MMVAMEIILILVQVVVEAEALEEMLLRLVVVLVGLAFFHQ